MQKNPNNIMNGTKSTHSDVQVLPARSSNNPYLSESISCPLMNVNVFKYFFEFIFDIV